MTQRLNRDSEKRQNKRPQLSDLRESGQIEQDADVIQLLYRPTMYMEEGPEKINSAFYADLTIAKQRNGPPCMIPLHFDGKYTRFSDHKPGDWQPKE